MNVYNCQVCGGTSKPHEPLVKHPVYRQLMRKVKFIGGFDKIGNVYWDTEDRFTNEIDHEIKCCTHCSREIEAGATLEELMNKYYSLRKPKGVAPPIPIALADAVAEDRPLNIVVFTKTAEEYKKLITNGKWSEVREEGHHRKKIKEELSSPI